MCASISEEILRAVKELDFDRYKYVVSVLIVEKAGQAMKVSQQITHNIFCKFKIFLRTIRYILGVHLHSAA